jgi:hypothetical protein
MIPLRAPDKPAARQLVKNRRCVSTALIDVAVLALACLLALRRIDAPKPDAGVSYGDSVAIYHSRGS